MDSKVNVERERALERKAKEVELRLKRQQEAFSSSDLKSQQERDGEEIAYLKSWLARLEHDSPHFTFTLDIMLSEERLKRERVLFVSKFGDSDFIDRLKEIITNELDLPDRETINIIRELRQKLESNQFFDPNISEFIVRMRENVFREIKELYARHSSSPHLKSLLKKIKSSDSIVHLMTYVNEVRDLKEWLDMLKRDDQNWTYFRTNFYPNRKQFAERLAKRYGHKEYADLLIGYFDKNHENRYGTISLLQDLVNRISRPDAMVAAEKQGAKEILDILADYHNFMKSRLKELNEKVAKLVKSRLKLVESGKRGGEKEKLLSKETDILKNLSALKLLLEKRPEPSELAEANKVLATPGKLKEGLKLLTKLTKQDRLGLYVLAEMIDGMIKQRIDYIKNAKAKIKSYIGEGLLDSAHLKQMQEMYRAIEWYDKEILVLLDKLEMLQVEIENIERYIENNLDRMIKTTKEFRPRAELEHKEAA